jgi:hypothetical protein
MPMACSHEGHSSSIAQRRQVAEHFDRLFGDRDGIVRYAVGLNGRVLESGSYKTDWREFTFEWPEQRRQLIAEAVRDAAAHDVYCRTTLRHYRHSGDQGNGLGGEYCWVDLDHKGQRTEEQLKSVLSDGSYIVLSGQPDHKHPYIKLNDIYPWEVIEDLNHRLDHYLDGGGKWAENTVLRVPGTLNHKGRAAGGEAFPVTIDNVIGTGIAPWSPDALRDLLGPLPTHSGAAGASKPGRQRRPAGEASRRQVTSIVPITPEPIPKGLTDEIMALVHFSTGTNSKGDHSRSGQLYRLLARLIEEGLTDGEVMGTAMFSEPGQDKFPDEDDLQREIQRIINKVRPDHQHPGLTCGEAACPSEVHPEISSLTDLIRAHFDCHYGRPRTLSSDEKTLEGLMRKAILIGDFEFDMSSRELCRLSGIGSRNTAEGALKRLIGFGIVEMVRLKNGNPVRRGKGDPSRRAYRYRLIVPDVSVEPHTNMYTEKREMWACGSTLILDPSHDIWRFRGLATVRPTYIALRCGASTRAQLGMQIGRTVKTIDRHLKVLVRYGLAEMKPDGMSWIALDRDPEELAAELGTLGMGEKQAVRHSWESENHTNWLSLRNELYDREQRELREQHTQDLINKGYRWVGPVLVPRASQRRNRRAKAKRLS